MGTCSFEYQFGAINVSCRNFALNHFFKFFSGPTISKLDQAKDFLFFLNKDKNCQYLQCL